MNIEDNNAPEISGDKEEDNNHSSESHIDELKILSQQLINHGKIPSKPQFFYQKRTGTAAVAGQLYETKLLSFILLRLLKDNNVSEFKLGTNIDGIGAFDDIVFRYKLKGSEKPRIVFIQAKHRDDPDKNKLSIKEIFHQNYLDSYIKIRNKFIHNSEDDIFNGAFKNVDCDLIFYTPVAGNFANKTITFDKTTEYLSTGTAGNAFQFDYKNDDIEQFLRAVLLSRSKLLAKTFMKFVLKGNYRNIMTNDLIKTYHVFLAHNVLDISNATSTVLVGKFSESFLESDDYLLKQMRDLIYHQLISNTRSTTNVEVLVKSFSFKLPQNFGNLNFSIKGTDKKKERRINYLCLKLKQLLDACDQNRVIKVNDDMVGTEQILQHKDLEIYRLGGLVGNLLIADNETNMLKFNNNKTAMTEDVTKLFEQLKSHYSNITHLTKYRFDIDCYRFPKLSLHNTDQERNHANNFLNNLKFYTKQAQEDEVERILKDEINLYCNFSGNSLYRIKGEAVFLKVHHDVQKWWKQPTRAPYLSRSCNFYKETIEEIFNSSLLSTFNYFSIKHIINVDVKFSKTAIDTILTDKSLKNYQILNIVTQDIVMTSIKLRDYLIQIKEIAPIFLDLQLIVSEGCFEEIITEINNSSIKKLVILCKSCELSDKLIRLLKSSRELIIVISDWILHIESINTNSSQNVIQLVDDMTTFVDLKAESQNKLLQNCNVMYQGFDILLGKLLTNSQYHLIKTGMLRAIINKEKITIGKSLKTSKYDEIKDHYVEQNISRHIKVNLNASLKTEFTVLTSHVADTLPKDDQDVILISDDKQEFDCLCEKYSTHNIHWFMQSGKDCVWRKSFGKINRLLQCVEKDTGNGSHLQKPMSLLDTDERIVILSGEPGMGKSTLMTYLSFKTKAMNPKLWIIQVNLINHKTLFSNWQENKVKIDLKEVLKLLFKASCVQCDDKANKKTATLFDYDIFDMNITDNDTVSIAVKEKSIPATFLFEMQLFCDCYNNGQIVLVFDGFDEITPDYTMEVIKMVETLKASKVLRLWITSRSYNVLNELQNSLGTFSFTLMPLSVEEQKCFLVKTWAIKLSETVNSRLSFYVNRFYETVSIAINDKDNKFTSIPLHLYMISEIYQHFFKDYYDPYIPRLSDKYMEDINDVSNLVTFYERFVGIKFDKIRFGEKKPFICTKDPDMKKMIDRERKEFNKNHKMLAAYTIFDKNVEGLFAENEITRVFEIMESIKLGEEKTGIIQQIIDNEPKFIHLTYAEYFATEYLCDKLKSKDCSLAVWIYLFNNIFTSLVNIRKFFECKLRKDQKLFELSSNRIHKLEIFNVLLEQLRSHDMSLVIALKEFSQSVATFILNSMKVVITKENLDKFINYVCKRCQLACAFCSAVERRQKSIVRHIIDIVEETDKTKVINLFKCEDVPMFNALGIAVNYCRFYYDECDMLDALLENIDSTTLLELFIMPCNMGLRATNALHVLVLNNDSIANLKKYFLKLDKEQRMQLFSTTDADSKLPAHFAGEQGDASFFDVLKDLLDVDQFREIYLTSDPTGQTPMSYLMSYDNRRHRLKTIIKNARSESEFVKIEPL